MAAPVRGYPHLATARPQGGPQELARGRVDVGDVSTQLLAGLEAIGAALHRTIVIFSGYRTPAYSAAVGGFADDPHTQHRAVDATIGGKPIGTVVTRQMFQRYGLETGNVPNFYQGRPDPAHVQLPSGAAVQLGGTPGNGGTAADGMQEVLATIVTKAQRYRVDPLAAIAVSTQEGLSGGVGDSGTSFGPWQLHIGGALPKEIAALGPQRAQEWAWSPAGIDYALRKMGEVAAGRTGRDAISAIVLRFERPARPGPEISGATSTYQTLRSQVGEPPDPRLASFGGTIGGWAGSAAGALGKLGFHAPSNPFKSRLPGEGTGLLPGGGVNPLNWPTLLVNAIHEEFVTYALRGGEVIFGAILLWQGLSLLARQSGVPVPSPGSVAAGAAKAGAMAAAA